MYRRTAFSVFTHVIAATAVSLTLPRFIQADDVANVIRDFADNPDYVQPFATLFGSMTNSGWYQSAAVAKSVGFYVGIPMNITHLADADRSYSGTYIDYGCEAYHQRNPGGNACKDVVGYTTPTIFGKDTGAVRHQSVYSPVSNSIIGVLDSSMSDGIGHLSQFNWFPFGIPQASISWWNTELKIRWLGLPAIEGVSFNMPGFALQHDMASFLPPLPVHISAVGNFSWMNVNWTPHATDKNIQGTMTLNGFSDFFGLLVGYTFHGWAEAFLETGWENASVRSGGKLNITDSSGVETITPNLTLNGRNGFRAALNVAIHFGYDAVLGQNLGAEFGNQLSLLSYRFK